ncbi:MAG TPA: hypothetical protein VER55_04335, partial [Ardenticatenaceae bacterium]|nr:hypothetical protein [Ardenticatenaceae bacterium]
DPEDRKPYVVAMLTSLATVGACTVAFAGLTTSLWQRGAISSEPRGSPGGLFEVEAYYVWHLVDALPLLDANEALHWESPIVFSDPWSGGLLLTFKVLLLIPLIRVFLSGLRLVLSSWLLRAERRAHTRRRRDSAVDVDEDRGAPHPGLTLLALAAQTIGGFFLLVGLPLFAYGVLAFVVRRSSFTDQWIGEHAASHIEFLGLSASTRWLQVVVAAAGAWLILAIAWGLADEILTEYEVFLLEGRGFALRTVAAIFFPCWLMLLATMAASGVTLILLRVGLADPDPRLRPPAEVNATLEWYSWHLANTIPLLEVTDTLHWTIEVHFLDRWTGVILVLMRFALIGLLLVPFALLLRAYMRRARRRRRAAPQIEVVDRFTYHFDVAASRLNRAERAMLANDDDAGQHSTSDYYPDLYQAIRAAGQLEDEIEPLMALLGESPAVEAARATVAALEEWSAAVNDARAAVWRAHGRADRIQVIRHSLNESRMVAVTARATYLRLAAIELPPASGHPVRSDAMEAL